ncbi:hypothetical protein [Myxococcus eversor]|uniref:hypothetical protein n=1 Tax=Myxococcus eversor TaxID=2709661 RepID=UPI0013D89A17|nr:hypothetical protein [Myxococcus eversor]
MRERPLLFSGPMVQALLDGRKTVTRRLVKERHFSPEFHARCPAVGVAQSLREFSPPCPYGQPGDRLWVRETWALDDCGADGEQVVWRADRAAAWREKLGDIYYLASDYEPERWRPSIHMPRWASRLTLEVTAVRVDRLHDITEDDAVAEGVERHPEACGWRNYEPEPAFEHVTYHPTARESFASLWRSINGEESWAVNPWVWRVEFARVGAST